MVETTLLGLGNMIYQAVLDEYPPNLHQRCIIG